MAFRPTIRSSFFRVVSLEFIFWSGSSDYQFNIWNPSLLASSRWIRTTLSTIYTLSLVLQYQGANFREIGRPQLNIFVSVLFEDFILLYLLILRVWQKSVRMQGFFRAQCDFRYLHHCTRNVSTLC